MNKLTRSFACTTCGCTRFYADRQVIIAQTLLLSGIDKEGNYQVEDDDLRDTVFEGVIERLYCAHCDKDIPRPNPLQPTWPPVEGTAIHQLLRSLTGND